MQVNYFWVDHNNPHCGFLYLGGEFRIWLRLAPFWCQTLEIFGNLDNPRDKGIHDLVLRLAEVSTYYYSRSLDFQRYEKLKSGTQALTRLIRSNSYLCGEIGGKHKLHQLDHFLDTSTVWTPLLANVESHESTNKV